MKREEISENASVHIESGTRLAIIVAEFNTSITQALLDGALQALEEQGVSRSNVSVYWVPGSFELPTAAGVCAETGKYQAVICLGAVIKGETDHYRYVCDMAAEGISSVSRQYDLPVMFGVLTCDTMEQAKERSKPDTSNTGYQVAFGALQMINTLHAIRNN